jgi:hypothetical protein
MRVLQGNPPWACLWIRHELLRPVPPWFLQQLSRPVGNPPYHPDWPLWLAGLGLRRWYTYLVYPQQYPPGNFKIAISIRHALFLVKFIRHSSSSFWRLDGGFLMFLFSSSFNPP